MENDKKNRQSTLKSLQYVSVHRSHLLTTHISMLILIISLGSSLRLQPVLIRPRARMRLRDAVLFRRHNRPAHPQHNLPNSKTPHPGQRAPAHVLPPQQQVRLRHLRDGEPDIILRLQSFNRDTRPGAPTSDKHTSSRRRVRGRQKHHGGRTYL